MRSLVGVRRLFLLVAAAVLVDTVFYAAIAPVLPRYADDLDLSKSAAGILTAAYPAGTLLASIPAGLLADRIGAKRTLAAGLALVSASSFAFAFARNIALLDAARFLQGIGGAGCWTAGFAWLMQAAPADGRGQLIGSALAAAVTGFMLGPVVGGAATVVGPEVVFSAVGVVALGLFTACVAMPPSPEPRPAGLRALGDALRDRRVQAGFWLVILPALYSGTMTVLVPLRMDELGASGVAIGAAFLLAAAVEATLGPIVGRISDRRGRLVPMRLGLVSAVPLAILLPIPRSALAVGVLIVVVVAALSTFWAPAMAMLSDAAEGAGVEQGFAFALVNLAWGGGQMAGGGLGAAVAEATADAVPYAALAALCAITLVGVARAARSHLPAPVVSSPR